MPARQFVTSVGTTATAIAGTEYPGFRLLHNGTNDIFLGDVDVTTANGFPIATGDVFIPGELANKSLRGVVRDRLYGRVASGTEDVRVIIEGRINP